MADDDLVNAVHTGRTIWHHSAAGVDLALFKGQIAYASGEIGTYAGVETINTADGTDSGYVTVLLEDGSITTQLLKGEETSHEGSRFAGTGTWEMVSGSGRFARMRRSGVYKWEVDGDKWYAEFTA